jgi:nucleoside-diphosphate-sugar epimerase
MDDSTTPPILVTGATGFLGTRIVEQLQSSGRRLKTTSRRESPQLPLPDYRSVDLTDEGAVADLVSGVETIVHSAGLIHGYGAARHPDEAYWQVNTRGTETLMRAAAAAGCRRFILVSSISVYGRQQPPFVESARCFPLNAYAQSKLAAEEIAAQIAQENGIELLILRMAPICGEGALGNVDRLIHAIDRRRFVWIGNGTNLKTLIHADDAASACVAAACADKIGAGGVYNVAAPPSTMNAIVRSIAGALGQKVPKVRLPGRLPWRAFNRARRLPMVRIVAQPAFSLLDKWLCDEVYSSTRFEQQFCWRSEISIDEAIRRQVEWRRRLQSACA